MKQSRSLLAAFFGGLGLGLAIGLSFGILIAPDSGDRTRKKLLKKAERLRGNLGERVSMN